jgi:hypothetical protein
MKMKLLGRDQVSQIWETSHLWQILQRSPKALETKLLEKLRIAGASNRAIADAVGVDHETIRRGANAPADKTTSKGKGKASGANAPAANGSNPKRKYVPVA